jgi:superfamily II DNA or RNA helicase
VSRDVLPTLVGFPRPEALIPTALKIPGYVSRWTEPLGLRYSLSHIAATIPPPSLPLNRFRVLPAGKVLGMNYRDRHWHQLPLPAKESQDRRSRGTKPFAKSYLRFVDLEVPRRGRKKTRGPSFWDLLYPILLPPLTIEKLESLYLPHDLYKYQPAGIDFLMQNESALLADEMGTGKTVMTTVALRILIQKGLARTALIVCPVSVLREWNRHLEEWAPELLVTFVRGQGEMRAIDWKAPAHVFATSYDTLRSDIESGNLPRSMLDSFDVVVLDEAQSVKNPGSGRSKAIKKLKPQRRWALTGTPVENKIEDMVSIFSFLRPGLLSEPDLVSSQLRKKIAPYFLRRKKKDVLPDLPPKQKQDHWLELDPAQRIAYDRAANEVREELKSLGKRVTRFHIFKKIHRLKQICNFAPGKSTSPKLDFLKEQIEDITASEAKVIVFSQYIGEGVSKLEKALGAYRVAKLIGKQSEAERSREIDRFKKQKDVPILLASFKAGGLGLNLTQASYVVHFDHWWNPATMWQAEDRVHRPGQKRGVNIYSYWMADTIEERIFQTLLRKGLLFEDIVERMAESEIDETISIDEWLEMLDVLPPKDVDHPKRGTVPVSHGELTALVERLQTISPKQFEGLAKDLLHSLGHPNVKVTGQASDGGIDVVSIRNTGEGPLRTVAQCKRYTGTVGVKAARELGGVVAADATIEKAYLITTGRFSRACSRFCEENSIEAIDGPRVAELVRRFGLSI